MISTVSVKRGYVKSYIFHKLNVIYFLRSLLSSLNIICNTYYWLKVLFIKLFSCNKCLGVNRQSETWWCRWAEEFGDPSLSVTCKTLGISTAYVNHYAHKYNETGCEWHGGQVQINYIRIYNKFIDLHFLEWLNWGAEIKTWEFTDSLCEI